MTPVSKQAREPAGAVERPRFSSRKREPATRHGARRRALRAAAGAETSYLLSLRNIPNTPS
jgi:hypothetical protein